ncbi:hypothetical protein JCGZ_22261 [Jatropha curcas]|uniref:Aminotransferase-like plant mobile domain-containing protein n=1 Tax=Jatropha curcas TaxID=180498 RepID=A0A067JQJ8_JATCU|nr:hypothetical protein JCGZ_22261 [Jatropha curcas]
MVFRFEDSEVTPTYEEMCAVMDHHPEQDETPALPPGPRYDLAEIVSLCPVYLPDGINVDQGLPLEPFLSKNRQPGIGDFRLLTVVRDMQLYHRTVFMMIIGETMCWARDIALRVTDFNIHHRGCPLLLQAWALDKLSLIPPVPARLIPTYGSAVFQSRSRKRFDFGDNPIIRWTCPWISRQYGMIQRVPRAHNFESSLITSHLLTNLADRWQSRNTMHLDEGMMQDTVTPAFANWFFPTQ